MKRILAITMLLVILFSIAGCGKAESKVPSPLAYPDYTFDSIPDTTQLRQTAVRAVRDLLTFQWCTENPIQYTKIIAGKSRSFKHEPGITYGGLPYTQAGSGLFQFLEYYDAKTGILTYNGTGEEMKNDLGSACADSLLWAITTVCNSLNGGYYPVMMVPANGYIPVGNYTIKENIKSYHEHPTYAITEDNGLDVILDAYSKTLPADVLISTPEDHAMMIVEKPTVVYLEDGSIDKDNSYLIICDQWTGSEADPNDPIQKKGRLDKKFTFAQLFDGDYIPLTAPEFTGAKAYEKATVTTDKTDCASFADLNSSTVESNYPLAVINVYSVDLLGRKTLLGRKLFNGREYEGVDRSFQLSDMEYPENTTVTSGAKIQVEVVVSTGERFTPIEFKA